MNVKGIIAGILLAVLMVIGAAAASAETIEFRLSYGGWSLSPFHSTVETKCEELIKDEFFKLFDSILPASFLSPVRSEVDLSSSGTFLAAEIWMPLGRSRFAVGIRGDLFNFKVPFTAVAREAIDIFGFPIAEVTGRGQGTVDLKGLGVSLLGRWTAVSTRHWDLSLQAGMSTVPFRGRIAMNQEISVATLLGDLRFTGRMDQSIADIREADDHVPSMIIAPTAGIDVKYRFSGNAGLFINATVSQGTFLSGGFFVTL